MPCAMPRRPKCHSRRGFVFSFPSPQSLSGGDRPYPAPRPSPIANRVLFSMPFIAVRNRYVPLNAGDAFKTNDRAERGGGIRTRLDSRNWSSLMPRYNPQINFRLAINAEIENGISQVCWRLRYLWLYGSKHRRHLTLFVTLSNISTVVGAT